MYDPKNGAYKNFKEHFANGDDAKGYKDLIPLFRAEKFNANEWAQLFKASGAQYVVPVAEHHDGFSDVRLPSLRLDGRKNGTKARHTDGIGDCGAAEGLHFGTQLASRRAQLLLLFGRTARSDVNDPK